MLYRSFEHKVCLCTDDLSKGRVATQSTSFAYSTSNIYLFNASNAVDRNITTCMRTGDIGRHSLYQTVWWRVDLGGVYSIYSVNILFKNYDSFGIFHIFDKTSNKKNVYSVNMHFKKYVGYGTCIFLLHLIYILQDV